MERSQPESKAAWTLEQLIEALNQMRDEWTSVSLALRDLQFDLDTPQRQEVIERANDLVNKVK